MCVFVLLQLGLCGVAILGVAIIGRSIRIVSSVCHIYCCISCITSAQHYFIRMNPQVEFTYNKFNQRVYAADERAAV